MTMREYEKPSGYTVELEGRIGELATGYAHVATFMEDLRKDKPAKVVMSDKDPHFYTKQQICRQVNMPLEIVPEEDFKKRTDIKWIF